jgi:hypothetical protein
MSVFVVMGSTSAVSGAILYRRVERLNRRSAILVSRVRHLWLA